MEQNKSQLKTLLAVLAMELELKEGRRFNITKGVEEVSKVLKFSLASNEKTVLEHLIKVVESLTGKHLALFQSKGIDLNLIELNKRVDVLINNERQEVVYRGQTKEAPTEGEDENKGKRKIVYRGQVTWV